MKRGEGSANSSSESELVGVRDIPDERAPGLEDMSDMGGQGNLSNSGNVSLNESGELVGLGAGLGDRNAVSKFAKSSRVILARRRLALMLKGDGEREDSSSSSMMMLSGLEVRTFEVRTSERLYTFKRNDLQVMKKSLDNNSLTK